MQQKVPEVVIRLAQISTDSVREYDLPDLAATLAPRNLLIINITDGNEHSRIFLYISQRNLKVYY